MSGAPHRLTASCSWQGSPDLSWNNIVYSSVCACMVCMCAYERCLNVNVRVLCAFHFCDQSNSLVHILIFLQRPVDHRSAVKPCTTRSMAICVVCGAHFESVGCIYEGNNEHRKCHHQVVFKLNIHAGSWFIPV